MAFITRRVTTVSFTLGHDDARKDALLQADYDDMRALLEPFFAINYGVDLPCDGVSMYLHIDTGRLILEVSFQEE